ncbi:MAG: formylglycine-generating enzyme family protein [Kiritimatiellae bacterium]|nr:formylglycine-generating enzyme family protein [Kiritimatiellia bacterium]
MSKIMTLSAVLMSAGVAMADNPAITAANLNWNEATRTVTVNYTLANAPAVVTVDFLENGVSVGEANFANVDGDVNRLVAAGDNVLAWKPKSAAASCAYASLQAVVTAWSVSNPPPYMVVYFKGDTSDIRYYASTNALPGGLLGNPVYRTSALVLRRISAAGVTWTMGNADVNWPVTLDADYYIGVFEFTQAQYWSIFGSVWGTFVTCPSDRAMRPLDKISYNSIRGWSDHYWPAPPDESLPIGRLRAVTGVAFDLPSEAQWEFACRAGHGIGVWGDGSSYGGYGDESNARRLGRYRWNGGWADAGATTPTGDMAAQTGASAVVGSYEPNSWGLYDMHGNVFEWCLDGFNYPDVIKNFGGAVNVDPSNPAKTLNGDAFTARVLRGGSYWWDAGVMRSESRAGDSFSYADPTFGFRVVCPVEAK